MPPQTTVDIRDATPDDAGAIARIYAPFVTATPVTFEELPPDAAEFQARIERVTKRLPWLVAEEGGRVVGYAYASPHRERAAYRWAVDVAVYLDPAVHRRGIGRALYAKLLEIVGELGYVVAVAGVTLPNAASIGLHEAMGFERVGVYRDIGYKLGKWRDVIWMQRQLRDPPTTPEEPRAWRGSLP